MDKVILKSRNVRRDESPVGRRERALQDGGRAEVRAAMDNGVVRIIEVVCTCGDRITVELEQQPEGEQATS